MAVVGLDDRCHRGASAPPRLVGQVIDALRGYASITVVERSIATETVRFGLPKQVRAQ